MTLRVDGSYGPRTVKAVKALQRQLGFRPSGAANVRFQKTIGVQRVQRSGRRGSSEFFSDSGDEEVTSIPARPIDGAPEGVGDIALRAALTQRGTPYQWSGESPGGFDCSGLLYWAYGRVGIGLPRVAADQARAGAPVRRSELEKGDAVFFGRSAASIGHIGLYIGGGKMVHAPRSGQVVRVQRIDTGYYARTYQGARRYSPLESDGSSGNGD